MKLRYLLFIVVLLLLAVPTLGATENVSAGMTVTCKGPYDILVSLGLEEVLPLAQARVMYNWISVALLLLIGAMASSRTTRFFGILLPLFAGLLMYFGWFTLNDPASPGKLMGVVVIAALIAVALYMKGSLHERFGLAGPGSMLFNLVFFIILLQVTVGFVNSTAIWSPNAAATASTAYTNIDLEQSFDSTNQNIGATGSLSEAGTILTEMAVSCVTMFITIAAALVAFSAVLAAIYPWIWQSSYGPAFLGLMQVGIYIVYYMALMRFVSKSSGEGDF